jgi:hypothetical protein
MLWAMKVATFPAARIPTPSSWARSALRLQNNTTRLTLVRRALWTVIMSGLDDFRSVVRTMNADRWGSRLAILALVVIVVGAVLTAVGWFVVSGQVGALILSGVFTATVGVLTIRQAILAERL